MLCLGSQVAIADEGELHTPGLKGGATVAIGAKGGLQVGPAAVSIQRRRSG
ncbi:MAG: hypothetical protein ACLFPV_15225 [Spirochaetaceae bacterium]